jgi:hypothetical protein
VDVIRRVPDPAVMSTMPHPASVTATKPLDRPVTVSFIPPARAGFTVGLLLGATHLAWAFLVAVGWAQPLRDFIWRLNFIESSETVAPFEFTNALLLVLFTTGLGFAIGWLIAAIWNWRGAVRR